jgi:hypothetical protein
MAQVTFLTTSFPRFGGDYAGVFVYDLARGLVEAGVGVTVLAPHEVGTAVDLNVTNAKYYSRNNV